jgi:hypothetical protein
MLRGKVKVSIGAGLSAIAHNLRKKAALERQIKRAANFKSGIQPPNSNHDTNPPG